MSKWNSFAAGLRLGQSIADQWEKAKERRDLTAIADDKPVERQVFTPEQGEQLNAAATAGDKVDVAYKPDGTFDKYVVTPAMGPVGASEMAAKGIQTDFLGKTHTGALAEPQVNAMRTRAMANVLARRDPIQAQQLVGQAQRDEREARMAPLQQSALERRERVEARDEADATRLRAALADDAPPGVSEAGGPSAGSAGARGESARPGVSIAPPERRGGVDHFLERVLPGAVRELMQQGKVREADALRSFADSEHGRRYARLWTDGVRAWALGDHAGALRSFERLYNDQLFADGHTVRLTPGEGEQTYRVEQFDPSGKSLGQRDVPLADLTRFAAAFLSPEKAVEHYARRADRDAEQVAIAGRQQQLEEVRQRGQEAREDRRDARLDRRLEANASMLDRRLAARTTPGLTATQQRVNAEIDAARETVRALDPSEIRRRTTRTTDTGRENPDYDPMLARHAALAARRKVGDDPEFDGAQRGAPSGAASGSARSEVARRFRADAAMNAYRLGNEAAAGFEVLDRAGKLVGHYR